MEYFNGDKVVIKHSLEEREVSHTSRDTSKSIDGGLFVYFTNGNHTTSDNITLIKRGVFYNRVKQSRANKLKRMPVA